MKGFRSSHTFLLYAITITIFLPLSSCDLITNTCKKTPNYQFCVSILRANPASRNSDVTGLALIIVDEVKIRATSTLETIDELLKSNPKLKVPLNECREMYDVIIKYDVSVAIEALKKGDQKFGENGMNDAVTQADLCDKGFKDYGSSLLLGRNKKVHDVCAIAAAIIRLLLMCL